MSEPNLAEHGEPTTVEMPKPTAWPMVLATGAALVAAGLVTSYVISLVGFVLLLTAVAGWVGELIPGKGHVEEPLAPMDQRAKPVEPSAKTVVLLRPGMPGHRLSIPEEVHPYSAGAKGGLAGGIVMAVTALIYGVVSGRGVWYPINLLAAMVFPSSAELSGEQLQQFSMPALIAATVLHLATSVGVGLFFGVLLPTLPRSPVFWGGVVGPLLWSAFIYGFMGVLNPVMNERVDWPWFVMSQFAYGLVMGVVVIRSEKIPAGKPGSRFVDEDPTSEPPHEGP